MPTPSSPVVIPNFSENRGTIVVDPLTKSTIQLPTVYRADDACGDPAYIVFGQAMTINQLIGCVPILAATISISGRIPADGDGADLTTIVDALQANLVVGINGFVALNPLVP